MTKKEQPKSKRSSLTLWLIISMWAVALTGVLGLTLLFTLARFEVLGPMPTFDELENPQTNLATEIYSADGVLLGTYFVENRTHLTFEELFPPNRDKWLTIDGHELPPIVAALIATEDLRFFEHSGIDFQATARAGIKTILLGQKEQGGGSTITQQLAKNLYKTRRRDTGLEGKAGTISAKAQEYVIATQLEYNYTKEEIVAMYLNTVEFSSSNFGIRSAANNFFGKEPHDLSIEEAAVIAGQVKAPGTYAPLRGGVPNPKAKERRDLVLGRMVVAGAISRATADSLIQLPIDLSRYHRAADAHNEGSATYFREMVRRNLTASEPKRNEFYTEYDYEQALKLYEEDPVIGWCKKNLKSNGQPYDIYRDGLRIYTTLDADMQRLAEQAAHEHMRDVVQPQMNNQIKQTKQIYLGLSKEKTEKKILAAMRQTDRWRYLSREGLTEEQIIEVFNTKISMEVFTYNGIRDTMMTPRDSIIHHKSIMRPAMVAVDPGNGYVRAYVGGPNYRFFKYDAATQTKRQIGSTAKPFIYAYAIEVLGMDPCKPVPNERVTIKYHGREWSPKEAGGDAYSGEFNPLYWGLMKSRNNYSAYIMQNAKNPEKVANYIHKIGIRSWIDPVPALCLGSYDSNPFEMAGAYSTFVNQGVRIDPIYVTRIEDKQGNILATFTPKANDVIPERVAHTVIQMMKFVITGGTGVRLTNYIGNAENMDIAAKTGTTNKNVDAWFMCAVPNLVIGTWVGGEENSIRFISGADGSRIALPITGLFLKKVYEDGTLGVNRDDKFKFTSEPYKFNCKMPNEGSRSTVKKITEEQLKGSDVYPDEYINQEDDFF